MTGLSRSQLLAGLLTIAVVAAVVAAMFVLGSPAEERARRLDERRVQDLAAVAEAIDVYWTRHTRLPVSLEELRSQLGGEATFTDPSRNASYEYRPLEGASYELCAEFQRSSSRPEYRVGDAFWSHAAGRQCFRRDAKKLGS